MKNNIIIFLILALYACQKTDVQETVSRERQNFFVGAGVTERQIDSLQDKYGLQEDMKSGRFKSFNKATLPYLNILYADYYFSQIKGIKDFEDQMVQFRKQQIHVKSYADYYTLLEQFLAIYKSRVEGEGGLAGLYTSYYGKKYTYAQIFASDKIVA